MKKNLILFLIVLFGVSSLVAESKTSYIPIGLFQTEQNENCKTFQYGGAFAVNHLNDADDTSINPAGFVIQATYVQDYHRENILWSNKIFHSISLQGEYRTEKNDFLLIAQSNNEIPFSSLTGTTAALVYGRQLLDNQRFSLILGGGAFLTKVTIGNFTTPVIPLPIIRFACKSDYILFNFDFLGSPSLYFTLFPESRVRIVGNLFTSGYRSIRDLCGDISVRFYLLPDHEILNVMNIMLGVYNNQISYGLKGDAMYENQYYGVYAGFDISALTVKGGFDFGGTQMIDSNKVSDIGKGFFISVQGGWQF